MGSDNITNMYSFWISMGEIFLIFLILLMRQMFVIQILWINLGTLNKSANIVKIKFFANFLLNCKVKFAIFAWNREFKQFYISIYTHIYIYAILKILPIFAKFEIRLLKTDKL